MLLKILELMLKKHTITTKVGKPQYARFEPRQSETIEDKLKCIDLEKEMPVMTGLYQKDFIAQVKEHIKTIIETGKGVKIATLSRYLNQEKRFVGACANMQIKLQQLKCSRPETIVSNSSTLQESSRFLHENSASYRLQEGTTGDYRSLKSVSPGLTGRAIASFDRSKS